jgi:hypothetical protein
MSRRRLHHITINGIPYSIAPTRAVRTLARGLESERACSEPSGSARAAGRGPASGCPHPRESSLATHDPCPSGRSSATSFAAVTRNRAGPASDRRRQALRVRFSRRWLSAKSP